MPWKNNGNNGGPWNNPNNPWGKKPRRPGEGPDLDELFKKGQKRFKEMTGGGLGTPKGLGLLALLIIFIWLLSGFYRVQPDEQGVVLRFGKWTKTTADGLHYHLPYPIESVQVPKVTKERQIDIGSLTISSRRGDISKKVKEESLMLTGDENIVDASYSVVWVISDAGQYLFNIRAPAVTVKIAAESAMREVISQTKLQDALTAEKTAIELAVFDRLQSLLNEYKAGIEVVRVQLGEVTVPPQVVDAFDDVQRAKADKVRRKNEGTAYFNDVIPRAKGAATRITEQANAHKQEVINRAIGDAARFKSVLAEYHQARNVTRKRLYLETMEQVLSNVNKVVIDQKGGSGVVPYLPLPEIQQKLKKGGSK